MQLSRKLLAVLVAALGLVCTTAVPAIAQTTPSTTSTVPGGFGIESVSDCTSGNWCYWSSTNFNPNPPGKWGGDAHNYDTSGWANLDDGFYNNGISGAGVDWYTGRNESGTWLGCTTPGFGASTSFGSTAYHNAESHRWTC